jgi:hypothetical protein
MSICFKRPCLDNPKVLTHLFITLRLGFCTSHAGNKDYHFVHKIRQTSVDYDCSSLQDFMSRFSSLVEWVCFKAKFAVDKDELM